MLRDRHQPCGRIVGDATHLPHFERAAEGVLNDVFRQREVVNAEDTYQGRDQPS
jgi:hypothetical protein